MIFSLDEELNKTDIIQEEVLDDLDPLDDVTSIETEYSNVPQEKQQQYIQPLSSDYLDINNNNNSFSLRNRRRSSVLDKFSVLSPIHTRRVSVGPIKNEDNTIIKKKHNLIKEDQTMSNVRDDTTDENLRNLHDFKPIRVLGRGAYGKVILVKDQKSSKLYAMKTLKKAEILINDRDVINLNVERTFAERTILSQLEHPNIVKLFYSFHDQNKLYLILQYVPGGELFYHLKEYGTLSEDTVSFYAAEISCALKFLHDKGIVYRDLKPENCLLNERGHLILTDFGLSKRAINEDNSNDKNEESIYTLHSIIGTPEYCAPEILQGLPYNKNCDWYSLGCLLYDMLIGKPPYTGNNHKIILNKILKDKQGPRIPFYLSEGMKDMLNWLLKKDKTKRWDVDRYWKEERNRPNNKNNKNNNNNNNNKVKNKKPGKQRELKFQSHFIFRKIDWELMESGDLQRTTMGPIVPMITDWELAENFDSEFTSMSYEDDYAMDIPRSSNNCVNDGNLVVGSNGIDDIFKGFSFKASKSYLERYF